MIWLTWRQFRAQAAVALGALILIVTVLAVTGPRVAHLYDASKLGGHYQDLRLLGTALVGVPALIGAFWGAPLLARELEGGTYRMVWTQSITRSRWLAVKLGVIGTVAAIATAVFSFVFTWWSSPFDRLGNRLGTAVFGQRGLAPVGYAVFAFVLGVTLGAVIRRTVPAMAATLAAFIAVRFGIQTWVRPTLLGVVDVDAPITGFNGPSAPSRGWIASARTVDRAGHFLGSPGQVRDSVLPRLCGLTTRSAQTNTQLAACARRLGVHDIVTMHPANQFWPLQAWETTLFLTLALLCGLFCFWWVRRRDP
jgi:hypothetical protein